VLVMMYDVRTQSPAVTDVCKLAIIRGSATTTIVASTFVMNAASVTTPRINHRAEAGLLSSESFKPQEIPQDTDVSRPRSLAPEPRSP
jgi:hypothetical protein